MTADRQVVPVMKWVSISLIVVLMACAGSTDGGVPDLERRAIALNKSIMCPVCPGESIDQSQNALAVQMRAITFEMLTAGSSEQEIKSFFVERYGPSVLLEPPTRGFGLAAWIVPPFAFALAVVALLLTLKWMRMAGSSASEEQDERGYADHSGYVRRLEQIVSPAESGQDEPATRRADAGLEEPRSR